MATELRKTGISLVGDVPWGTHFCSFYEAKLGCLSWNAVTSIKWIQDVKEHHLRIEDLRGIIVDLDEVLTMSARMAAATGETRWEERYRKFEPELGKAIEEALSLAPDAGAAEVIEHIDEPNTALVEMEHKTFDLVRQHRLEEAPATLFSGEYDRQKAIYAVGMHELDNALIQSVLQSVEGEVRRFARERWEPNGTF